MKITTRIATTEYSYIEAEFDNLEQFRQFYPELKNEAKFEKAKSEVPFPSAPQGSPRGTKVVGQLCDKCGMPYVLGKKGAYCKPCYVKWAEENKK